MHRANLKYRTSLDRFRRQKHCVTYWFDISITTSLHLLLRKSLVALCLCMRKILVPRFEIVQVSDSALLQRKSLSNYSKDRYCLFVFSVKASLANPQDLIFSNFQKDQQSGSLIRPATLGFRSNSFILAYRTTPILVVEICVIFPLHFTLMKSRSILPFYLFISLWLSPRLYWNILKVTKSGADPSL